MPNPSLGLLPCKIGLFEEDKNLLEAKYGRGWTREVRDLVHKHCQTLKPKPTMKLEDSHGDFT